MKTHSPGLLLTIGLVVGGLAGAGALEYSARAQGRLPGPSQRFQISAWGYAAGTSSGVATEDHGCYIVDTVTGQLWHASKEAQPRKVSGKLL